mmetsp:Transcript_22782/g.22011  ORF Transcript_22782/g.22011 Transcript_22782/m.22011 type:complete len:370 (+) Transcript_22782:93-1202(+)
MGSNKTRTFLVVLLILLNFTHSFIPQLHTRVQSSKYAISMELLPGIFNEHVAYMKDVAKVEPPARFQTLLQLLDISEETVVSPSVKAGLNPFLIPLSRDKYGSMLCYMRWPTQKDGMDLQLVRTTEVGVYLVAMGTDQYCHRLAVEQDFMSLPTAPQAVALLNAVSQMYTSGDYIPFLKSGKFPSLTKEDLNLILDRFLLTKVGAFPDCYERLAKNFVETNNEVSALVTCERAVSIFYGWGHPVSFHAKVLSRMGGREKEARDAARASLGQPAWTVGKDAQDLEELAVLAGFTGTAILGEMHAFRARDARLDDIGEGMSPIQVILDQAAHLMDAVALGHIEGGWAAVQEELASKYQEGGYPEMAEMIKA